MWMLSDIVIRLAVDPSWNGMVHVDTREEKWRGNWRSEWVPSTLYTTSEHGVFSITTADVHTSAASSRMNWRSRRFKWTRPFRRKTKSGFCACATTFRTPSNNLDSAGLRRGDVVNVEIRLRSYRSRTRFPARERALQFFETFIRHERPTLLTPARVLVVISPKVKGPGRYIDHSVITIVEVKN
jgi:hypothetical protein